ncbi:MAG: TrmO family methyltransferase [Halolamina sp.]|uniref:TrmO family methyltransferase domain-containing protein n=1 Tax=Halolamina sp. TaxID=1940283 RepID=UPI002FC2964D
MSTHPRTFEFRPIGVVHTPFDDSDEAPRQGGSEADRGTVVLAEEYTAGIVGLEPGTELDVIWVADRADRDVLEARGRGVFTTRSPARPNPICVTRCTVRAISDDRRRIDLVGVDMLDESPVLDLKAPIH